MEKDRYRGDSPGEEFEDGQGRRANKKGKKRRSCKEGEKKKKEKDYLHDSTIHSHSISHSALDHTPPP